MKILEEILEELEGAEKYKKKAMESEDLMHKDMYEKMAEDEETHAKNLLSMHPEVKDLLEKISSFSNPY